MTELVVTVLAVEWIIGAIAVGWAAHVRGRSRWSWISLAIMLSPLFAVLLLIAAGPMTEAERSTMAAEEADIADQEKRIAERRAALAKAERGAKT